MFNTTRIFTTKLVRSIHTTNLNNGIGQTMKKIMKQPKKKKPFYEEQPVSPHTTSLGKDLLTPKNKGTKRRVTVLNKLFMRHITDLMATSDMSSTYAGIGLEINRVEVAPNFNAVNVFWIAKDSRIDEDIEEMLMNTSKQLRFELSQLRVIGIVPKIYFIKDKHYARIIEVDRCLTKADFGEDHEPLEAIQRLKTELMINMTLQPYLKEKILKSEEILPEEVGDVVPDMPQDVLGLNHKDIMDKIKASVKKTVKPKPEISDNSIITTVNTQPIEFKSAKSQREAFKQFLMERQILKRKMRRAQSKQTPDLDYFEDEYNELREQELLEALQPEEDDYIEDVDISELNDK